ncbi:MAG: amidohydrolase [Clostridia bacterium]|nr:amidohydrolase [Clostridia bacterium]MBQ9113988.1 amidohydrolase [Clostridia bacterium]
MEKELLKEAEKLQDKYVKIRRTLHANAETGFDLPNTKGIVIETLTAMGYAPKIVGKGAVVATLGERKKGKAVLLRADMDGLPIAEKTCKAYACKRGNMHACGHDMHTAMLLMAAELLKGEESRLSRPVVFLFQSAEETLEGAKDVVSSGLLSSYNVGSGVMLHVLTATDLPTGRIVVSSGGVSAPAADYFTVQVTGKACHGSSPQNGVDALSVCARILLSLETLSARELPTVEPFVLTVGKLQSGVASNAIADRAVMQGTLRAFDESVRVFAKKRLKEIAQGTAKTFRAKAEVSFTSGCPALKNDGGMSLTIGKTLQGVFGKDKVFYSADLDGGVKRGVGGSEDFAYIANEVPSVMLALAAGNIQDGYKYPLHHPKTEFDEGVLHIGGCAFAAIALKTQ